MSRRRAFSICSSSPSLMALTALETISSTRNCLFRTASNRPCDNKKSPTSTAILFFHKAFTEKKLRRSIESSTTSSCTSVAVCRSSIRESRYESGFADFTTDLGGQKHKHGPHLLALAPHNVIGDFVQQRNRAAHGLFEVLLKLGEFLIDWLLDGIQRHIPKYGR